MKNDYQQQLNFVRFKSILKSIVIIVPVFVLYGWYANIEIFKSINPSWIAMRVNTSFCFLLCGISLVLLDLERSKKNRYFGLISKLLASVVGIFGFLTLLEFITGISNGIDSFFYLQDLSQSNQGTLAPGRMAANTSLNFILISIALLLLQSRSETAKKYTPFFALVIALISMPALIGYCYGAQFEGGLAYFTQMAIHTSVIFILLSLMLSLNYLDNGFMSVFINKGSGGIIARRLLPLTIIIPFIINFIVLKASEQNLFGFNYAMTLSTIVSTLVLGFIFFRNALIVSKMEEELIESHTNLEKTVERRTAQFKEAQEKALIAVVAKSDFLSNMSHEIRTPLNAIVGMVDLLSETELTEDQEKFVQTLKRAGDNLLILINDILDFSKLESSELKLEEIEFDLNEIIESTSELLAPKAHSKKLDFVSFIKPDVPTLLIGDPHRLRQILVNLLSNSIKFTNKGEIILKIENNLEGGAGSITFSVTDTGIGIPEDKINNLFERFIQVDSSITRKYGGTGLGLSISNKIVQLMKGELNVSSIEGKGSKFFFTLKFGLHQNKIQPATVANFNFKGLRTLIVDDNESDRMVIVEILKNWGAFTQDVDSGEKALEILKNSKQMNISFDLLLLDQRMPGLNGFEVYQNIKDNKDFNSLVTMMITSDDRAQMIIKANELGIKNYLIKPVKKKELWNLISQVYQKSKMSSPEKNIDASSNTPVAYTQALKILLVDDSEDNRVLIMHYLKKFPYDIVVAQNGEQGVERFLAEPFDLILMDIQMPVMDGYTATKLIREHEVKMNSISIPIVALTAFAQHEDEIKSLKAGCTAHLTKPIKKQILLEKIIELTKK
jgi:two-component system sensor histidine kinase/response regulator